jgi:hypothetical protein
VSFCSAFESLRLRALRDAEVEHLHVVVFARALRELDVRGLQIAVHDALVVRLLQRAADLRHDAIDALRLQRPAPLQQVLEALAREQLHRDVELTGRRLSEVVHADRVRMLELAHGADLAHEARDGLRVLRELREQRLHCDLADARSHLLVGGVHAAHAALAEDARDAEAPADDGADQRIRIRSGDRRKLRGEAPRPRNSRAFPCAGLCACSGLTRSLQGARSCVPSRHPSVRAPLTQKAQRRTEAGTESHRRRCWRSSTGRAPAL